MEDRISMAFTLRQLDVDSVPINFLMPIAGTPMGTLEPLAPLEALHAIALFRLILPDREIRICGGRRDGTPRAPSPDLPRGGGRFMIGNYLTRTGFDPDEDLPTIRDLGLRIAMP